MAKDDILKRTWLGVGEKTGGVLIVIGVEGTESVVFNLSNASNRAGFGLKISAAYLFDGKIEIY